MRQKLLPCLAFIALQFILCQSGLFAQNIALGKNATASSSETGYPVSNINDGQGTSISPGDGSCSGSCTRWSSAYGVDPSWVVIDLAAQYNLTEIKLYWEAANGRDFLVEVSDNNSTWNTLQTVTGNTAFINTYNVTGATGRYVRIYGTARNLPAYGFSLWEVEIKGTAVNTLGTNLALGKTVTASSQPLAASNAVDGGGTGSQLDYIGGCSTGSCSRWASDQSDPQWIYVDLGSITSLYQVVLNWASFANARNFEIQVSTNASSWTTVATVNNNSAYVNTINIQGSSGRYVRMQGISRNASFEYSLYEFEVYGLPASLPVKLYSFTSNLKNGKVDLTWKASTDGPAEFVIERSADGKNFSAIGTINFATAMPNGETSRFTDAAPLEGNNFYRLKYTELGQSTYYSDIVLVSTGQQAQLVVYPNPVTGNALNIDLVKPVTGNVQVFLLNSAGAALYNKSYQLVNNREMKLNLPSAVVPGYYMLQVIIGNDTKLSKMVLVK